MDALQEDTVVPIGGPIANVRAFVVDERMEPVPVGVTGELLLGGVGVARGYVSRPGLTAESFVADPFSGVPGARLYRTGDWARWRSDGVLEFMGRLDDQVKVRGFRVEPGEVEAALTAHPAVGEAVVVGRQDGAGDTRLVGYWVPSGPFVPTTSELRSFLKTRLPDFMIPAAFVSLEGLPVGPTGKLDRAALPAPDSARPDLDSAYVPPSTPAQKMLADIWASVLGVERVGIHDNFFDLGGDSILSIQVAARAMQSNLDIDASMLFECQTIAEVAERMDPFEF